MARYRSKLLEDFFPQHTEVVIQKTCNILSRRIGQRISVSSIPVEIQKSYGKFAGVYCLIPDGRKIRFNWSLTDTSANISYVDFWFSNKRQPDVTLATAEMNIIKLIDVLEQILQEPIVGEYALEEGVSVQAKTKGKVSKEISDVIGAWSTAMEISDDDLKNRRIADLYKSYLYWYNEARQGQFKFLSAPTFRNYLLAYMDKYGIKNIYMRTVTVSNAGKEKTIVTDERVQSQFDKTIYELSLRDTIDFVKTTVATIVQGLKTSIIIGGTSGIGKSKLVKDTLLATKGRKNIKWVAGVVKNPEHLYKLLYMNRTKNDIIVFDDVDSVFQKNMRSLMLACLSPTSKRVVSFVSDKFKDPEFMKGKRGVPNEFIFEGSIIITTNRPKAKIDPAIVSRTSPVEINVDIPEIIDDIRINLDGLFPEYKNLTLEMKTEILDFLESHLGMVGQIDYRLFKNCCAIRAVDPPNARWKMFCLPFVKVEGK